MQNLSHTTALLARTPASLNALLRDLPDTWIHTSEGPGTWSVFDVIGHLNHGERTDWIPRARHILAAGDTIPFEPFDRFAQTRESAGKALPQLLDEFAHLRAENLTVLRALKLQPTDLTRSGTHPSLGRVTLSELLATWAAHDMNHLHQIARTMAHQYRNEVGPWSQFLGVLHCFGHGA
jgi:hypothetical protein